MYPGVLAVSIRKYVYSVLLLAHTVPLPPAGDVEQLQKHCDPLMPLEGSAHVEKSVVQVRQCRRVEPTEVQSGHRARCEHKPHRTHSRQAAKPGYARKVRAAVEKILEVQVREARHVRSEPHAREVLPVSRSGGAIPGREAPATPGRFPAARDRIEGTVKILSHFTTAPRPAPCGYSSSSVTSR